MRQELDVREIKRKTLRKKKKKGIAAVFESFKSRKEIDEGVYSAQKALSLHI